MDADQQDRSPKRHGRQRARPDPAAEARASLDRLNRPTGFLDGWVMPPRPKDAAAKEQKSRAPDVPLGRLLAGPALLFAVLLCSLLLLTLILD